LQIEELKDLLNYVNHSREKRAEMASMVSSNPKLIKLFLEVAHMVDDPISSRASWVLEFSAKENLEHLFPYLEIFTANLGRVHLQPSVRPMAKICEYLICSYFSNTPNKTKQVLTDTHLEQITTACFDWLIGDHKVAAQAYSMTSLLLLGRKFDWILPELKMILEKNYTQGSAAYKARARMTLAKIK